MTEAWLAVNGYEGSYEVSSLGRVKSLARVVEGGQWGHQSVRERILEPRVTPTGYLAVNLYAGGSRRTAVVHRLVAIAFLGEPAQGQIVCHNDGNRANNRVENLRWDTYLGNSRDTTRHGTASNQHAGKTHCKQGHEFTDENTRLVGAGRRQCRTCDRARARSYYRAKVTA